MYILTCKDVNFYLYYVVVVKNHIVVVLVYLFMCFENLSILGQQVESVFGVLEPVPVAKRFNLSAPPSLSICKFSLKCSHKVSCMAMRIKKLIIYSNYLR